MLELLWVRASRGRCALVNRDRDGRSHRVWGSCRSRVFGGDVRIVATGMVVPTVKWGFLWERTSRPRLMSLKWLDRIISMIQAWMLRMRKPHSHRLRTGRFSESNRAYLLTTVCNDRERLFSDLYLGRIVVRAMYHHHQHGYARSLAFVVMPDHLHWLMELPESVTLSRLMQSFKSYTAREINRRCRTPGKRIWQPGYHDHALRDEEALVDAARYIVANPLRAGLVPRLADYSLWDAIWL